MLCGAGLGWALSWLPGSRGARIYPRVGARPWSPPSTVCSIGSPLPSRGRGGLTPAALAARLRAPARELHPPCPALASEPAGRQRGPFSDRLLCALAPLQGGGSTGEPGGAGGDWAHTGEGGRAAMAIATAQRQPRPPPPPFPGQAPP